MTIQPVSFTGTKYFPDKNSIIMHFAYNHIADKCIEADILLKKLDNIDLQSTVSVFYNNKCKLRLQIEAGDKTYTENRFSSPLRVLKKAYKHMKKLAEEQRRQNELLKGMTVPKL